MSVIFSVKLSRSLFVEMLIPSSSLLGDAIGEKVDGKPGEDAVLSLPFPLLSSSFSSRIFVGVVVIVVVVGRGDRS